MERGREGRRGGVGGGPVSAPRRPRTSGFKDATVGEDCDDILDDAHNQRLRERTSKKDSSSGQGLNSGSIGSGSRNKRKRQNSQEVQAQVRNNIADEVDETTEDTEMGASEDDDDPPPPPFPRRMGKSRPQGKFVDDGISADLPAVPRKARTATWKRTQESPPVVDAVSSHGSSAVSRTPPLSNAPSSSSVASLKPGRRTKPCSSKPRAAKVPKVSQTTPISESEVEVAEALYDLALGIFQPPLSQEEKSETKTDPKSKSEPRQDLEIKSEPKVSVVTSVGQSSPPRPPPAPAASVISAPSAITSASVPSVSATPTFAMSVATPPPAVTSPVAGPVTTSPATQATTPSPVLSPPPPPPPPASAPPPAEAPKRKRPRVRAKLEGESGSSTQSRAAGSIVGSSMAPSSCGLPPPVKFEPEQVSKSNSPTAERITPVTEACEPTSSTLSVAALPVVTVTTPTVPTLLVSSPPPSVQRHNSLEKKAPGEKKSCKVETITVSAPADKKMNSQPDRKGTPANVASPPTASSREAESVGHVTSAANEPATKLELGKRSAQQTSPTPDTGRPIIDLMVLPVSKPAATIMMDRTTESTGTSAKETPDKPNVDLAAPPPEASWMDREKERDKEREREREKERERERERERDIQREKERERERDIQRDEERERERDIQHKERERERDIQRDKERERERDIQRDKERERERDIQRDKERERERDIQRDKERERERDIQRDKERERERDIQREKERERERDIQREKERELEKEREREREREKDKERQRERENHREISQRERENQKEVAKERERKEDREKPEVCKQQPPPQRAGKVGKSESRGQKAERAASANTTSAASSFLASAPSVVTAGTGGVSSGGVSLPLSVGVAGWPVGLPPIGYYASTAGTGAGWPGAASLQGAGDDNASASVQLPHPYVIQPSRQPWKRCATHVYIAHFIDVQQNFQRQHSYLQAAAYQNTANLYGAKTYNLNHPLPPPSETLFSSGPGGPLPGGISGSASASVVAGGGGSVPGLVGTVTERSLGPAALGGSAQGKERVYMEGMTRKQTSQSTSQHQQPTQITPSLSLQAGSSAGGTAAASSVTIANGGVGANSGLGTGSNHPNGSATAPAGSNLVVPGPGTGAGGGGVANHAAAAQAQYLQGFMQSGGFPFPFQSPHFGPPAFSGPSGHLGPQQAAQFFGPPYYTTHLVPHPPSHAPQQLQQSTGQNTGGGSAQKQQQHNPQQAGRNFPPSSPQHQQQSLAPPAQSPSHSQQQHPQGSNSQQVQRPADRDGPNAGDSSSTAESKFPMSNRGMYGQTNPNVTVSTGNPPASVVLGAGMPNLPTQDYTLINALGPKQAKQQQQQQQQQHQAGGQLGSQQQSNLPSQLQQQQQHQPQVVVQHHGSGPALQMTLKGIEQQSSQTFPSMSMGAINRGPGPLGLAPVAAVMAPQGHVMLQSMGADPSRVHVQHHQSVVGQPHQHPLQQGQQQQRGVQMQRVGVGPPVEDRGGMTDTGAFNNRTVRETGDDRKISSKRGMNSSSALNRVDLETSASMQGSPTGSGVQASRMTGNVGTTLNLMSPTSAMMSSRSGQPSVGNSLQQSGSTPPGSQSTKQQVMPRGKVPPGSGGAPTAAPAQPPLSFSDRNPMGAVLSSKHSGQNLSLPGPNVAPTSQGLRQGPVTQHSLKLSNRPSLGSMPTPSGTAPQAVLAAAIAKAQNQGQQQGRSQGQATTNPGPPSRVAPGSQGNQPTSAGMPLPPLPPVSKSAMTSASKSTSSGKGSFPPPHKAPGGAAGKRSTPASGSSHVGSILGPSPLVQSLPSKPSPQQQGQGQHHLQPPPQQQQNVSQLHAQQSQPPQQSIQQASPQGQSLSPAQQQQYQQAHLNSQQQKQVHMLQQQQQIQQMRQQMFLHNPSFQPHQQPPGSPMNPHPQQQSVIHQQPQQQPTQQMHQQASPTSSQPQQQQQHSPQLHQQQHLQGGPTSFSGHSTNGTLSIGPTTLTLGTGSNGNSSNSSRASSTDGMANSQGQVPRSHSGGNKGGLAGSGIPNSNSNTQRSHGSGPSFLHGSQFNTGVSSGQQQSSSPRNGPGSPYLQPSSNTGTGGKSGEQKSMSDANTQEQINGMRMLSGSSPSRMATGSLNLQSIPQRPGSGGSSAGKSLGGQFGGSNHGEGIGSRSGLMLSVAPPSMSSNSSPGTHMTSNNGSANSSGLNPSPHLGSDGRPMYGGSSGSANHMTGQSHGGSPHQSSLSSPPGTTPNSQSGQSGMLGQTSSSVQP